MSKNPPAHAFAVNVIEFNKSQMGTFVSGGGDGSFVFWDGLKRTKLKGAYCPLFRRGHCSDAVLDIFLT
jgi:hypothetical protein